MLQRAFQKTVFVWFLLLALAGCAGNSALGGRLVTPETLPLPPEGMARIYFYRTDSPFLIAKEPEVVVNGVAVGRIIYGEAFFRDARPGRYEAFIASDPENVLRFNVNPGDVVFIKAETIFSLGDSRLTGTNIPPEEGRQEVLARQLRVY